MLYYAQYANIEPQILSKVTGAGAMSQLYINSVVYAKAGIC